MKKGIIFLIAVLLVGVFNNGVHAEDDGIWIEKYAKPFASVMRTGFELDYTNICDGDVDKATNTWNGTQKAFDFFGYYFYVPQIVSEVVYVNGPTFVDGGWFSAAPAVQVYVDSEWQNIDSTISEAYDITGATVANKEYSFTFEPVECKGVRVCGTPGGTGSFISCGEMKVKAISGYAVITDVEVCASTKTEIDALHYNNIKDCNLLTETNTFAGITDDAFYDWIGYTFPVPTEIDTFVYVNGTVFVDGGWFREAPVIQVLVDEEWKTVASAVDQVYDITGASVAGQAYCFTMDKVICDGVRIYGLPGGAMHFISCSEALVFNKIVEEPETPIPETGDDLYSDITILILVLAGSCLVLTAGKRRLMT